MSHWVEPLEGRSLFAAAVPATLPAAYSVVVGADYALRADAKLASTDLAADRTGFATDVRALGTSSTNAAALRMAEAPVVAALRKVAVATNYYAHGSERVYGYVPYYAGLFNARPGVKADHRLKNEQDKVRRVATPRLVALAADVAAANTAVTVALAMLTKLAAANTGAAAQQLTTDIQTATAEQAAVFADTQNNLATAQTALAVLDGTANAPDPTATTTTA